MKKLSTLSLAGLLMFLVVPWRTGAADVYVYVGFDTLSPNPVYIKTGDAVYWLEGDPDFGPYLISGAWGNIFTPDGVRFNVGPGNYNYTAQSVFGGNWGGTVVVSANQPPSVSITSPTNGSVFMAPGNFSFEADASDPDPNDVMDVEFWIDDAMVDDVYSAPYTTAVTNLEAGTHTLEAVVWDYSYARATNTVVVTVVNPPPVTLGNCSFSGGKLTFQANGVLDGTTNVLQRSTNLMDWDSIQTNISDGTALSFTNSPTGRSQFYRVMQLR